MADQGQERHRASVSDTIRLAPYVMPLARGEPPKKNCDGGQSHQRRHAVERVNDIIAALP